MLTPEVALTVATAVHAGFQLTVTVLVYPALLEVDHRHWSGAHERHSRRIVPLVAVLYAALLAAGVATVVAGPGPWGWTAVAATAGVVLVTAGLAAPVHGELGRRDPSDAAALRRRLVLVDRVRCALAVAAAVAAVVALRG